MIKDEELQPDLEKLAQEILGLEKPVLLSAKKDFLRDNILKQVSLAKEYDVETQFSKVIGYIKRLAGLLKLDLPKRAGMKERVFAAIENTTQKSFFWRNLVIFNKKMISGSIVALLFLGMFSFVSVDTSVVMAQTFTVIESFTGEVDVVRDGKAMEVVSGMDLFEGDEIVTGGDGLVVVRYFDDSITRLSANTEVIINKLFRTEGSVQTYVEIGLESGVVWSRVMNAVGGESAFVLKAKDVQTKAKKATFNVKLADDKLEVEVFNRSVDISRGDKSEKVLRGQKALINGQVEVVALAESEKNVDWVKTNLESDKQYLAVAEERLLDAKIESMGKDAPIGTSFREDVAVFLTFNDVDKQKKELDIAEKNLIAAEIKLSNPDLSEEDKIEAEGALTSFADKAKVFNKTVKDVGYSDQKYSQELKQFLDNKILTHQKELSTIMPDSPLYQVKEVVDEVALAGISDSTELVGKTLDQVSEKLAVAEDAAVLGRTDVSQEVVDNSKKELGNVVEMIDVIGQSTPEAVSTLVPKVDEVQQYLTAVSNDPVVVESVLTVIPTTTGVTTEPVTTVPEVGVPVVDSIEVVIPEVVEVEEPIDTSVKEMDYGIYIKGDKLLPPGFSR
ncbi:MAG: FecR domain-containing protein [Candidatus Gracilibacteria bacterium]